MAVKKIGEGTLPVKDRTIPEGVKIIGEGFVTAGQAARRLMKKSAIDFGNQRDPGVDYYSGIDATSRADFSRQDTEAERIQYLTKRFGKGNFRRDSFGAWIVDPKGAEKVGINTQLPIAFDEQGMSLRDLADMRGDAPALIGAGIFASLTGGMGLVAGSLGAGGIAMIAKMIDERLDEAAGMNLQSQAEVAKEGIETGLEVAATEAAFRGVLGPSGRKLMRPERARMTPRARELAQQAKEIGARPSASQLTRAPILGRTENMIDRIFRFNEKMDQLNLGAIQAERARMVREVLPQGRAPSRIIEGGRVQSSVRASREKLSQNASRIYGEVDVLTGGSDIVPTARLRARAQELLDALPVDDSGNIILTDTKSVQSLQELTRLPEKVSTVRMQAIRDRLRKGIDMGTLTPDMSSRESRLLTEAASGTFDDAADTFVGHPNAKAAIEKLREANKFYATEIRKFQDAFINRLVRDPRKAGSIDPESVTDMIFRPGMQSRVAKVRSVVDEDTWKHVQAAAMEDITESLFARSPDPTIQTVLSADNMLKTLDKFGRPTLNEMFGKSHTDALYRLGEVTQLVTLKQALSGGLVAAHIALHPVQNLPKLVQLNVLGRFMHSEAGVKWLTEGFENPTLEAGSAALARATLYIAALADDETGVAKLTLTDPAPPEEIQ